MLQNGSLGVAPKDQELQGFARPVVAASIHMCVANKSYQCCTQGSSCYKGSADRLLLACTCVLQKVKKGSTVTNVWRTTCCCCGQTHVRCRIHQCRVAPRGLRRCGRPNATEGRHVCCKTDEFKVAPKVKGRPRAAARTHIARAHKPCRIDQTRVEPTDQGLQRFGRATDDVSIHMCVAE